MVRKTGVRLFRITAGQRHAVCALAVNRSTLVAHCSHANEASSSYVASVARADGVGPGVSFVVAIWLPFEFIESDNFLRLLCDIAVTSFQYLVLSQR